jgi:anti-anti-sigma factor
MANKVIEMQSSKVSQGEAGAMTVLTPKESVTHENYAELEETFNECINQHKTRIILDCKNVSFIDSEGLSLLVRVEATLTKGGGILKVVGLNSLCRDIFMATRLLHAFYVYEDVHEAIRSGP